MTFSKKITFSDFFVIFFFNFSLTYPIRANISKRYSSLKSLLNLFKLFLNFLLMVLTKVRFLDFWNFEFLIFSRFFYIYILSSLTWEPMGAKTSIRYTSLKLRLNFSQLLLNFLLSGPGKSTVLDFWNFELTIFFLNSPLCPVGKPKPSIIWKKVTVYRNGVTFGPRGWVFKVYRVRLTVKWL